MHRPDSCAPTGFRGARAARLRATINLPNQDNHVHHETALDVGKRESIVDDFYIRTRARRVLAPPPGASSVAYPIYKGYLSVSCANQTKNLLELSVTTQITHYNYQTWLLVR